MEAERSLPSLIPFRFVLVFFVANTQTVLTRSQLSTGRWHRAVWVGRRDATKPLEIPANRRKLQRPTSDRGTSPQTALFIQI